MGFQVVNEDEEVIYADTCEEAIAIVAALVGRGGEVAVHEVTCAMREHDDEDACTCTPQVIPVGEEIAA